MSFFRSVGGAVLACALAACATSSTQPVASPPATASANPTPAAVPQAEAMAAPAVPVVSDAEAAPVAASPPAGPARPAPAPPTARPRAPAAAPTPAAKAEPPRDANAYLSGKLDLVAGGSDRVVAGEVAEGVVYFLPKAGNPPPKPGTFTVDTRSKGFSPAVLVVPAGSTVRFPNRDSILHNVFSRTTGSAFDFGYYRPGETKQRVFSKPGLVIVNCNVHHNMRADIVVLATPYFTRPDRSGRYRLDNLPAGPGTLVFWHPRANAQSVAVGPSRAVTISRKLAAVRASRATGMAGH